MTDYGFHAVIAPSFGDIFYNNSLKSNLLPVVLSEENVAGLVEKSHNEENYELTVDLQNQTVSDIHGYTESFKIDEFRKYCLLNSLDDIGLTLQNEAKFTNMKI